MDINEKIQKAKDFVAMMGGKANEEQLMCIRNDAANIFADSFEEYMTIWTALKG